jgi:hypothetical protein
VAAGVIELRVGAKCHKLQRVADSGARRAGEPAIGSAGDLALDKTKAPAPQPPPIRDGLRQPAHECAQSGTAA